MEHGGAGEEGLTGALQIQDALFKDVVVTLDIVVVYWNRNKMSKIGLSSLFLSILLILSL